MDTTAPARRRSRVGRETVIDSGGKVVGYELLFHPAEGDDEVSRDASTSGVITAAFGSFASQVFGTRRQLYVNAPRAFFTTRRDMPFSPQNVVLEILGDVEVDEAIVDGVIRLKERGFRVAVDGWATGPDYERLLPIVDVVKVDLADLAHIAPEAPALAQFVDYVHEMAPTAHLLADGVKDEATRARCVSAGFTLFQGPHFHKRSSPASATSVSQLVSLRLLAALSDPETSANLIEQLVSADAGLSLRVLGMANSAGGATYEVTSLRQAIVLVGRRQLTAWVMLGAFHGRMDGGREEAVDVLTRARMCELLAARVPGVAAGNAYAAGLVTGVVDILGADAGTVVKSSNLTDVVAKAVLEREGELGALLDAVEEFDQTGLTTSEILHTDVVESAHLHALGAAVMTVDTLIGD